jgi:hypothetical protein
MNREKEDAAIRKAIEQHVLWLSGWTREDQATAIVMISPTGKRCTFNAYCNEAHKQMRKTIGKIRQALASEACITMISRDK